MNLKKVIGMVSHSETVSVQTSGSTGIPKVFEIEKKECSLRK